MKYLLLIYGNQEKWASIPAEEWPEAIAKQDAFNRKYRATGELIGAYGLADAAAARLVRRENGLPAIGLTVDFAEGEEMRTEVSAKFRREGVSAELATAGFAMRAWWTDSAGQVGLSLSAPA